VFTPCMAPFTIRTRGPAWFTKDFPTNLIEDEAEINVVWEAYLTPTFLSSKVTSGSPYGIYGYQPNLVARQFGLIQPKPCSLYKCVDDLRQPLIRTCVEINFTPSSGTKTRVQAYFFCLIFCMH